PARVDERRAVASRDLANLRDLCRRSARRRTLAAGGEEPELAIDAAQSFLHRAADSGGDAARVPVEAEHAAERLKPEGIGESAQHIVRAELAREVDHDLARQSGHAREQPGRCVAGTEGEGGDAGVAGHAEKYFDEPSRDLA